MRSLAGVCQSDEVNATQAVSTTVSVKQATQIHDKTTNILGDANKTVVLQEVKNTTVISPRPPELQKGTHSFIILKN